MICPRIVRRGHWGVYLDTIAFENTIIRYRLQKFFPGQVSGQPIFSMKVRDCPNGKSIPAIHGPGFCNAASNSSKLRHSINSPVWSLLPLSTHSMQVIGLLRLGLLVKVDAINLHILMTSRMLVMVCNHGYQRRGALRHRLSVSHRHRLD